MKKIFIIGLFLSIFSCKYKENKATYSIIEVDTIAIDQKVLQPNKDSVLLETANVTRVKEQE